jgi:hypothetical protein
MKLPQLTLRDLFWLVLVAGMGCAWWVDNSNQRGTRQKLTEAISEAGYRFDERDGSLHERSGLHIIGPTPVTRP